jgi:membrane protein YqaA with SNARE-associated domain
MTAYWLIFISAFAAATLLPFYSEVAVVAGVMQGLPALWVWLAASLGNTLGAVVNYVLGRFTTQLRSHRWFPFSDKQMATGERWFQRYGVWSLLFAWLPIGGDALTFIAGVLRVRFSIFLALTAIGKSVRYAVLILTLDLVNAPVT